MASQSRVLLTFSDKVNEIYNQFEKNNDKEENLVSAPTIKLVGTQSSGKSSTVNRIVGFELIPMGENMVTRTPINIRLHNIEQPTITIVLSVVKDGVMTECFRTIVNQQSKTQALEQFRKKVSEQTDEITKNKWSISNIPLYIDIYSNKVANFSFVDLPGLVTIACTDKGQSEKLTEEIEELITSQIIIPNTIVLTVIQSKTDLETDIGLALVKKLQNKYKTFSTIGVMTKPDLLDSFDKLNDIVANKISKSVMLDEGYFIINNKTNNFKDENEYFTQRFDDTKEIMTKKRYGIVNLTDTLQKLLIVSIKKTLPEIKNKLADILKQQKNKEKSLGVELKDSQSKTNYFNNTVYQLGQSITNSLESATIPNVGAKIGKIIDVFVNEIEKLDPFTNGGDNNKWFSDKYISEIIDGFSGYHLTTRISTEQLVERCITDKKIQPIMLMMPISEKCVNNILMALEDTVDKITRGGNVNNIEMYPNLRSLIVSQLIENVKLYGNETLTNIINYLKTEEDFFWSTDKEFRKMLASPSVNTDSDQKEKTFQQVMQESLKTESPETVKKLSSEYFKTIKKRSVDYIVKLIISGVVKKIEKNITSEMSQMFISMSQQQMNELFCEDNSVVKEREIVAQNIQKIEEVVLLVSQSM